MGLGPSLWARDVEEKNLGGDEQSPAVSGGVCSVCCKLFPRLQKGKDQGQTGGKSEREDANTHLRCMHGEITLASYQVS